jgi:hypothetical protein
MSSFSCDSSVFTHYQTMLQNLEQLISVSQWRQTGASIAALVGLTTLVLLYLVWHSTSAAFWTIAGIGTILGVLEFTRSRARALQLAHLSSFYEQGLDRLKGAWQGKGNNGTDFTRPQHLYQDDLSILGAGSVFELLCTTRSQAGAERLASYLLDSSSLHESKARQEAVRELTAATELREQIASLGKYQYQRCDGAYLREWLSLPTLKAARGVAFFLFTSSSICFLACMLCLSQFVQWGPVLPWLLPLLLGQAVIGLTYMRRVRSHLKVLLPLANELGVLRQGLALLQGQQWASPKLRLLTQSVASGHACRQVCKIERLARAIEHRAKDFFYVPSLFLAVGTQLVFKVDRWRTRNRGEFLQWIDAWAEFDALNALACYAYEHPRDIFPELLDGSVRFEAASLCHPLLNAGTCCGNSIALNDDTKFYLISGSNMSGKSTFLRTIGVNAVLAAAGAPVRAESASMSVFRVCASLSVADSLAEGRSKFLAEVERLRKTIRSMEKEGPVLFLIDEILSGTNSADRRVAAQAIVHTLIRGGAVGAFSTHDLALGEIAESPQLKGTNVHMQAENPDDPLEFDYRLKPGILRQTNALAIVKMFGIDIDPEAANDSSIP